MESLETVKAFDTRRRVRSGTILLKNLLGLFFLERKVKDEKEYAHADRGVGDVEGWPMIVLNVAVEKVDDLAQPQAVEEIADRPTQNRGDAELPDPIVDTKAKKDRPQQAEGKDRRERKKEQTKAGAAGCQDPKGSPGIADISQAEKPRNDRDRLMKAHGLHDVGLADLIENNRGDRNEAEQDVPSSAFHRMASTQRSHSVGWSGIAPTVSR